MHSYLDLFENGLFTNKKFKINNSGKNTNKLRKDTNNLDDTDFMLGMSTWTLGIATKNLGLQLLGLNKLWNNRNSTNSHSGGKVLFASSPKVHLANGIKLKENISSVTHYFKVYL